MHAAKREGVTDPLSLAVLIGHAISPAVEDVRPTGPVSPREAFIAIGAGAGRFDELIGSVRRDVEVIAKFLEGESA